MITKGLLLTIAILGMVAASCSSAAVSTPIATPVLSKPTSSQAAEQGWKLDWDKALAAAKHEEKVAIYTTYGPGQTADLRQGFEKAHGLNLEFVSGRGAELREKLFRERRAGLYLADFFMMGASGMLLDLKPDGVLDPLKPKLLLPEVVDPKVWWGGNQIFHDKERTYVMGFGFQVQPPMAVNSDQVKSGEIKSHSDLLSPRWKGKIVINDPTTTGGGQEWLQMAAKSLGFEFMRKLASQEPMITRDLRQQTEWVARGKYSVLLGPHKAAVAEFMTAGAPLKYLFPSDVSFAGSGLATIGLINRPAHPNAAKVFINWFLTREGQTIISKALLIQSARVDVPTDHIDPEMVRQSGAVYLNASDEELALERDILVKEAASIFGIASK